MSAMLIQSDINKWRLSKLAKLRKLYINSASTRLLQISKSALIEYNNQKFPNNSHIHLIPLDDASSYNCPSPITGSNFTKCYCISNSCSVCLMMNEPYL